jgi:hypothetical protein
MIKGIVIIYFYGFEVLRGYFCIKPIHFDYKNDLGCPLTENLN